jgi:hypothetical protein
VPGRSVESGRARKEKEGKTEGKKKRKKEERNWKG